MSTDDLLSRIVVLEGEIESLHNCLNNPPLLLRRVEEAWCRLKDTRDPEEQGAPCSS